MSFRKGLRENPKKTRKMIDKKMSPTEIIEKAKEKGFEKFVGLVSGGKDSITASHIVAEMGLLDSIVFIDTTIGIPDTKHFVKEMCEKMGWKLMILKPKMSYEEFVLTNGFPHRTVHSWVMRVLKLMPLAEYAKMRKNENVAFISGIRKYESKRRMRSSTLDIMTKERGINFVAPCYFMTTDEIWNYVKEHKLDVSPVYKTLHLSGDCLCGAFADSREAEIINIFYPEIAEKISKLELSCRQKYRKWGNASTMTGAKKQKKIENFICADCTLKG